jgi:hypothetical protein
MTDRTRVRGAAAIIGSMTAYPPSIDLPTAATARCVLEAVVDGRVVLSLPHTSYRLHLALAEGASVPPALLGRRVRGEIHADAQRIFKAAGGGGGQFIEPLDGEPRIVAGRVVHVDAPARKLLVDIAVPMWMSLSDEQPADTFAVGDMVNCYVNSGVRFLPRI